MSEETTTTEVQTEAAPVAVTVQDVANAYAVIDLAAKRGAFQATELQAVGTVANRLKAFLDAVEAAKKAQAPADAEAEGSES